MCGEGDETMQHLFFNFPFVQGAAAGMPDGGIGQGSIAEWLEGLRRYLESLNMFDREKIVMIWYEIWYARNMKWMAKQNRSIPKS